MKTTKAPMIVIVVVMATIITTGGLIMLNADSNNDSGADNSDNSPDSVDSCNTRNSEPVLNNDHEPILSNDVPFIYDKNSTLTVACLKNTFMTMSLLNHEYPIAVIRENEKIRPYPEDHFTGRGGRYSSTFYTVYSLKNNKLAYVRFRYGSYTSAYYETYYIDDIIVYPYTSPEEERKMTFLLPQDQPENILKNRK